MVASRLLQDIQGAEGCRLVAYRDSNGFWTIGYGHFLEQGIDWEGHEITLPVADNLLAIDIATAEDGAQGLPEWKMLDTECRRNAIVELVFNMGRTKWEQFVHARAAIERADWAEAAAQLLSSAWAHEVQPAGLTMPDGTERRGRATRLAGYLRSGEYPA